jgi:hypothetical protein
MRGASERTLPSARPTRMPPAWAVEARVGAQLPRYGRGRTWNFDAGPMLMLVAVHDSANAGNSG